MLLFMTSDLCFASKKSPAHSGSLPRWFGMLCSDFDKTSNTGPVTEKQGFITTAIMKRKKTVSIKVDAPLAGC